METKDFEVLEKDAIDSPVKDIKWYGKEDKTEEKLMYDRGVGKPIVIRLFEFELNPALEKLPTKEDILTPEYIKQLQIRLWADELRLVMEPRVVIENGSCKIFAPCEARAGSNFIEEAKTIQEWTN